MFLSRKKSLKFGIFFAIIFASGVCISAPFSQYGMIQNVQNYSASPFYNPQTGTITAPNIVYATGPKLQASDCQRAVASVVENVCASRNNCQGTVLTDIRPAVMVQLSVLPNYNYASSCGGYIDTAYENYMRNFSGIHTGPSVTSFPSAPTKTNTASNLPQWQQDYNARAAELRELQSENGGTGDTITKTAFPKTFNDLTMAQQNEIKRQGYAQYKDARVYVPLNIEPDKNAYKTTNDVITDEANATYTCIAELDAAETAAVDVFPGEYIRASDVAIKKLKQAVYDAKMSACTCTDGKRFQDKLRQDMDVKCDNTFKQNAETAAQDYVDDAVALVTPTV